MRLNNGSLLKDTFRVFVKNYKFIVMVCLFAYLPFNITTLFVKVPPLNFLGLSEGDLSAYRTYMFTIMALRSVFISLVSGAYTYLAERSLSGQEITVQGMLDMSLMKWSKLVFTSVMCLAIYSLTSFLILLPIYFAIYFLFCLNVVATTDLWGFGALKEGMSMVRGRWWRMFSFSVVLLSVLFLVSFLNTMALWGLADITGALFSGVPLLGLATEALVKSLLDTFTSFPQLAIAVCFYHCRKETGERRSDIKI